MAFCSAGRGAACASDLGHPLAVAVDAFEERGDVEVDVKRGPMEARSIAEDLDLGDLFAACSLQALEVFAWKQAAVAVAHLQDEQVEAAA